MSFAEFKTISFQISSHKIVILNDNQFKSMTSASYEYHSWTKTTADAFWKKTSKNWSESVDFVKSLWTQQDQNEYIDLDIFQCKISSS